MTADGIGDEMYVVPSVETEANAATAGWTALVPFVKKLAQNPKVATVPSPTTGGAAYGVIPTCTPLNGKPSSLVEKAVGRLDN